MKEWQITKRKKEIKGERKKDRKKERSKLLVFLKENNEICKGRKKEWPIKERKKEANCRSFSKKRMKCAKKERKKVIR